MFSSSFAALFVRCAIYSIIYGGTYHATGGVEDLDVCCHVVEGDVVPIQHVCTRVKKQTKYISICALLWRRTMNNRNETKL